MLSIFLKKLEFFLIKLKMCILSLKKIFVKKTLKALLSGFPFSQPEMVPLTKAFRKKKWVKKCKI